MAMTVPSLKRPTLRGSLMPRGRVADASRCSSGLPRLLAQQALRPEHEDQHEVAEHDRRRPLRADPVVGDLLDHADDQAAEDGALDVADAAHDGGGERDQAGGEAGEEPHVGLVQRVDEAGGAGHQAAEQERERDRRVHVDAHQARGLRVLRGGAHGAADPGAADEVDQEDEQRHGHHERQDVAVRDRDAEDRDVARLGLDQVGHAAVRAAEPEQADVLQDEGEADRGDEGGELGRVAQRPVADPLDHHVERSAGDHADEQDQHEPEDRARGARGDGQADRADHRVRHEAADHEQVAVGEVDQLDDAVDERVADGDQRPDGAVREAVLDVGGEPREVAVVLQVLDAVGDREDQQDHDQPVLGDELARDVGAGAPGSYGDGCRFHEVVRRRPGGGPEPAALARARGWPTGPAP